MSSACFQKEFKIIGHLQETCVDSFLLHQHDNLYAQSVQFRERVHINWVIAYFTAFFPSLLTESQNLQVKAESHSHFTFTVLMEKKMLMVKSFTKHIWNYIQKWIRWNHNPQETLFLVEEIRQALKLYVRANKVLYSHVINHVGGIGEDLKKVCAVLGRKGKIFRGDIEKGHEQRNVGDIIHWFIFRSRREPLPIPEI